MGESATVTDFNDRRPPTRYISHEELRDVYSGDYDVPMKHLTSDPMFREQAHPAYEKKDQPRGMAIHSDLSGYGIGGYAKHVANLAADIRRNGMQKPLEIRNGNVLVDGHHRALAAMRLKLDKIPVRDTQ